ncbi:MAG: hypothetical protein V8T00_06275 [Oscillospiraceae bacterium]
MRRRGTGRHSVRAGRRQTGCDRRRPPRKGVSEDVIEAMAQMSPERIVYVSCDPATLARDIARLREKGYEAKKAHCFDLFPRCAHVETVVLLEKTGDGQENADCGEMR